MLFRSELFVNEKCEKKKNCETQILGKTEKSIFSNRKNFQKCEDIFWSEIIEKKVFFEN